MDNNETATPMYYRIRDWESKYETHVTRPLKEMRWVAFPIKLDGEGYNYLISSDPEGIALFGVFVVIAQVAARCTPRGTLIRSNGTPHTAASIALKARLSPGIVQRALDVCSSDPMDWIERCPWNPSIAAAAPVQHNQSPLPVHQKGFTPTSAPKSQPPAPALAQDLVDPEEWQRQARETRQALLRKRGNGKTDAPTPISSILESADALCKA